MQRRVPGDGRDVRHLEIHGGWDSYGGGFSMGFYMVFTWFYWVLHGFYMGFTWFEWILYDFSYVIVSDSGIEE